MSVWVDTLVRDGVAARGVHFETDAAGIVVAERAVAAPPPGALALGLAAPGFGNAHSHAFHRALRGRTHGEGGTFWTWRDAMYAVAARLDPDRCRDLARAVFAEMLLAGWTAVGEFHYVHHRPDGTPYPDHDMALALADAAEAAGIRLVLLDTLYLTGGVGVPLSDPQRRFGDRDTPGWLDRWHALRSRLDAYPGTTLGAALHSVRAVPPEALAAAVAGLPAAVALHVHLSEQVAENEAALRAYGMRPAAILDAAGALSPRTAVVHATHVDAADIGLLSRAGARAVFCPTTEADLGDGIGPARELLDNGVRLAVGSDQNAVVDPFLELRGLEAGERLRSRERGRIGPADLWRIGADEGYGALKLAAPARIGGPLDLVELDPASVRTAGSRLDQLVLTATGSDVTRTLVGGRVVTDRSDTAATGRALASAVAGVSGQARP